MIKCLKEFHAATGKVHRDVKPENFRVHNDKVYLIDFGNSFDFIKDGAHIFDQICFSFKGTMSYASIFSHEKHTHSRRDDLEGLGYTILSIISGAQMPWELIKLENEPAGSIS